MCTISFQFQWHLHTNHLPQACSSTHLPSSHAYTSLFSYPAQYNSKWRNANGLCSKHQHLGKKGNEFSFGSMPNPLGFLYGVEQCERSCKTGMLPSRREGLLSLVLLAGSISLEERNAGAQDQTHIVHNPIGIQTHACILTADTKEGLRTEFAVKLHSPECFSLFFFPQGLNANKGALGFQRRVAKVRSNICTRRLNARLGILSSLTDKTDAGEKGVLSLERYSDEKEGFTLLKPSNWKKVDKAGATVLFEDPEAKANNVGVVVNPVRISSLKEFGTVHDVADKLLQAEKNKPSTNDAQLIRVEERPIHGDIPLYKLEYTLDSTRGIKRILSAVIVASKKLYLLNIAYLDSPDKPLLVNTQMSLEQIVDSFDVLN
eukprot:Gb_33225 [translate_table: standard]